MPENNSRVMLSDEVGIAGGDPYAIRDDDLVIILDAPNIGAITSVKLKLDDNRIQLKGQSLVPNSYAVYVAAVYGKQLHDEPLSVAGGGLIRAFTFGHKISAWLENDNGARAAALRSVIKDTGTTVLALSQQAVAQQMGNDEVVH